jgi:carboxypeptidase C (cathepsin A)
MADSTDLLQNAFQKNPYFKVMVVAGYYDLATPYFSVKYTMNHLGTQLEAQKRITWQFYESGHMVYIEKNSRAKLKKDFADFIRSSIPATQPG